MITMANEVPLACFFCHKNNVPLDWYREMKEYVCEACAKQKRLE